MTQGGRRRGGTRWAKAHREASRRNRRVAAGRATSGDNPMDDRFDRRELLLHFGDMLQALSCLARTGAPDTPVAQLAREQHLFRDFEFLRTAYFNATFACGMPGSVPDT